MAYLAPTTDTQLVVTVGVHGQRTTGSDVVAVELRGDVIAIARIGIGERTAGLGDLEAGLRTALHAAPDRG